MEEKDSVKDKDREEQKTSRAKTSAAKTGGAKTRLAADKPKKGSAAESRPKSATAQEKKRTSTGRPLQKTAASQSKKGGDRSGSRKAPQKEKKKTWQPGDGWYLVGAVVVGLILAFVVSGIMKSEMLKTNQKETEYNIGDIFDINNYVESDTDGAVLSCDSQSVAPDALGEYDVSYTIRKGKLTKKKKITINVVDNDKPYISGEDEIEVPLGEDIVWSDYFDVKDEDPDIAEKLTAEPDVDTSAEGTTEVTLSVTDWAGNSTSKTVTVKVRAMSVGE